LDGCPELFAFFPVAVVEDEDFRVQLGCPFCGGEDEGGGGGAVGGGGWAAGEEDVESAIGCFEYVFPVDEVDEVFLVVPYVLKAVCMLVISAH
jgi:hypothetical protein